jgi:hypothetical protein
MQHAIEEGVRRVIEAAKISVDQDYLGAFKSRSCCCHDARWRSAHYQDVTKHVQEEMAR